MDLDYSSASDVVAWAETLRQRVNSDWEYSSGEEEGATATQSLKSDMLDLIDQLIRRTEADGMVPPSPEPSDVAELVASSIDGSLARWQANLSDRFQQFATSELEIQLAHAAKLGQQLEDSTTRIEAQHRDLESRVADNLEKQSRLERQRVNVAEKLKRRKTELYNAWLQQRDQLEARLRDQLEVDVRCELEDQIDQLEQRYREQQERNIELDAELEDLRRQQRDLLETSQCSEEELRESLNEVSKRCDQYQQELSNAEARLEDAATLEAERSQLQQTLDERQRELEEASGVQEELDRLRSELEQEHARVGELQQSNEELENTRQQDGDNSRERIEELEAELDSLKSELQESRERLQAQEADASAEMQDELEKLRFAVESAESERDAAREDVAATRSEFDEFRQQSEEGQEQANDNQRALEEARRRADEVEQQLEQVRDELTQARQEAEDAKQQAEQAEGDDAGSEALAAAHLEAERLTDEIDQVRQEMEQARLEINDLESQNSDLAAQLAKQQVSSSGAKPHVQFDQESLSWEERKQLIMQQLECEDDGDVGSTEELEQKRLEVEQVVASTQLEIEKRDREIEELQSIVEQQANTSQGVAIGAAAIAQMLDSDELIAQERLKLKEIQQEWEEKLRQAEIDLSMERAKLARERSQLEEELQSVRTEAPASGESKEKDKRRKWLEHLGLRDEKGSQK